VLYITLSKPGRNNVRREEIDVSPEVEQALEAGMPVVALETTIVAHGMPYPTNLETAIAVERIVRFEGAVPATLGIVAGRIRVGMTREEIKLFATGSDVLKAGERDVPMAVAGGRHAATTAGASLAIAAAAGIRVFVTGGIGGVGPGAGDTFDVSADLLALADYPCMTVCAGAKAFMDIAATLEFLETHRVPVVVYQSDDFPLFYCRSSGQKVEWAARDAGEIAGFFAAKLRLGAPGGMLVGVPLPEEKAVPNQVIQAAIRVALERAQQEGITGKEVTPFVLSAIKEETGGQSLEANVALIENNARVGARIAVALAERLGQ
jgi:pseudouridine-5'-phosphate glycosidase